MKIKLSITLALFFSLLTLNAWGADPPWIVRSIPANFHLTADPWTLCLEVTFSEPMVVPSSNLDFSPDGLWVNGTSSWSADKRTFTYCRSNSQTILPVGNYWITLNPGGRDFFRADATGLGLPETTIYFTVVADGNNDIITPYVVSTVPSNCSLNVDPATACVSVTFSEPMDQRYRNTWSFSNSSWQNATVDWSRDGKTVSFCRGNTPPPLANGTYILILNPVNPDLPKTNSQVLPFCDLAYNNMPQTTITFTVDSNPLGGYNYYVPYFKSGNGYWTGVGISNHSDVDTAAAIITLYNADGTIFASDPPHAVQPNGQFAGILAENQTATGWAKVSSYNELTGLCFMGSTLMADIPFVSESAKFLMIPHVAQDNLWDTKVMVCNPNNTPAHLNLTFYSPEGLAQLYTPPQPLAAFGSTIYELGDIFMNSLPLHRGKVLLTVTQGGGIAAFALYSNTKTGGSHYAGINAVPVTITRGAANPF